MKLVTPSNVLFIAAVVVATHFLLQPVYRMIDQKTGATS